MSDSKNAHTAVRGHEVDDQYLRHLLAELSHSKARLEEDQIRTEAMLNSLGEGLITTDENGHITMINSYALESLGFSQSELVGKWFPKAIVAVDHFSRPIELMSRPIIKALSSGQTVSDHTQYITKSGALLPVFITVSPLIIDGKPVGAIEVFQDLTNQQQLDVAKEEFVSLASHQLRTPATGVKSILSMLAAGDFGSLTPVQKKYIDKASETNNRQLQLIEDLLNVALVDAGKMELDLEYTDITLLIREAVFEHQPILASRKQSIKLQVPSQLNILMDPPKIRMVIDNLISNASKYSNPSSRITITLSATPDYARIAVTDQGVGIAREDIPKLFSKFTRLSNELSAVVGGTGLGLFLTKNIIGLHGGTIDVASEPGQGSTFTVVLPVKWRNKQ